MEDIENKNDVISKGSKQSKLSEDLRISQKSLNYKPNQDGEDEEEAHLSPESWHPFPLSCGRAWRRHGEPLAYRNLVRHHEEREQLKFQAILPEAGPFTRSQKGGFAGGALLALTRIIARKWPELQGTFSDPLLTPWGSACS